jgi:hypothetical protein
MFASRKFLFASAWCASGLLAVGLIAGCASKAEKALQQAQKQAAATGQPQQVVTVDKNGTTTTTVVQPPAQGQKQEAITTTTTPAPAGQPLPKPSGPAVSAVPQPPPPPPAPVNVTIPAGTTLAIRIDQRISVKTAHPGDGFTGEVVEPIMASDGSPLIPKGAGVKGVVDAAHRRGHFKGRSILELRLTTLNLNGQDYTLKTSDALRTKKGKGRRSAGFIGGGAGLGMLIGGVASGGAGLLIGGLSGAGAGTAAAGLTGNRDIVLPAETVIHFRLASDLTVQQGQ